MQKENQLSIQEAHYVRVSPGQPDVGHAVAGQLQQMNAYAKTIAYFAAPAIVDVAGRDLFDDRPQLRKLIVQARKPGARFQVVLASDYSRNVRDLVHFLTVKSVLEGHGVRVISITDDTDYSPNC